MITKTTCHFCASRCGLLLNIENGRAAKLVKAPCEKACPAGIDVPRYTRLIADGKLGEAVGVIREKVPFPGVLGCVCTHPCETQCRRGESDEALSIRALKAFAARHDTGLWKQPGTVSHSTGKKTAIIGSGPAGLTAGYFLARQGHGVTVFEALPEAGGMMRTGIPNYRLPRDLLDREIDEIKAAGVDIRTNHRVDSLDDLFEQDFDAIFIGIGAQRSISPDIDGMNGGRVKDCLSFLRDVNLGHGVELGERVAVIGGGYAAIDASRTARRLGATEVTIIYRRTRQEMPASDEEIAQALAEGVDIHFLAAPSRLTVQGDLIELECIRQELGGMDASGRRRPEAVECSEFSLHFDTVITAIGQRPEIPEKFGLATGAGNTIQIDPYNLSASREGVFAGGDVVTGPASVIEAIAAGREAARAIDRYLGGEGNIDEELVSSSPELSPSGIGTVEGFKRRLPLKMLPEDKRTRGFDQVELGFDGGNAAEEANRCLWCDMAEGDPDHPLSHGWSCKRGRADTARRYR